MGFLDRLFGRSPEPPRQYETAPTRRYDAPPAAGSANADDQAIERYRYMLRTAPPDAVEQAHAEAFAQLTPEQRQRVLRELSTQVPEHERATSDDPRSLARMATRAEMRQPGTMERTFGGAPMGGGMGMGGVFATSLLASIAGYVIASAVADQFFGDGFGAGDTGLEAQDSGATDQGAYDEQLVADSGGDWGGDAGGDLGGGDFGGGDI